MTATNSKQALGTTLLNHLSTRTQSMKRWIAMCALFVTVTSAAQISPQFFGVHVNEASTPWPPTVGVQFAAWRSVSSSVKWSDINLSPGVYDWSRLDTWLATTAQYGESSMYNLYFTPGWASSCPKCICSQYLPPGGCFPPNDLNSDGSGTDRHLKDFITALMQHVGPGKINYIEIWNEPNISTEYQGTVQQLVRMTADVRSIVQIYDPDVLVVSPPETGDGLNNLQMNYLASYFAAGGGPYVDVIALHGYVSNPEDIIQRIDNTLLVMSQYGQSGKAVFVTEGSWCCGGESFPGRLRPGFTFRRYLSMLSTPAQKFYLFAFDADNEGDLWSIPKNKLTANGLAYQLFYSWLVGATITQPCQPQSAGSVIWRCSFTKPQGYEAEAIWTTTIPLRVQNVTVASRYVPYRDLYGNVVPIQNHLVPVGYAPLWLENMSSPIERSASVP